jgi:tetratricopeptide (TPR) repeat protein
MFKSFIALCAAIASTLGISTAHAADGKLETKLLIVRPGDLIVQQDKAGWKAIKILAVDAWPDGSFAAHCLTFESSPVKPTAESLKRAPVRIWHAPIDAQSFGKGWELVGNQMPSTQELAGFTMYLKLTDFPRYVELTQQDPKVLIQTATDYYTRANALGDQGKRLEAIAEYTKAIDTVPLFFEAIDNRAFTYMELGRFGEALSDFEESLRANPDGVTAFFSRGECLMKLGQLVAAEKVFLEGQHRFPAKRDVFSSFLQQTRGLQKKS